VTTDDDAIGATLDDRLQREARVRQGIGPVTLSPPARWMSSLINVPLPGAISGFGHTTYRMRGRGEPATARAMASASRRSAATRSRASVSRPSTAPTRSIDSSNGLEVDGADDIDRQAERDQPLDVLRVVALGGRDDEVRPEGEDGLEARRRDAADPGLQLRLRGVIAVVRDADEPVAVPRTNTVSVMLGASETIRIA
jgi:hypothetical protein